MDTRNKKRSEIRPQASDREKEKRESFKSTNNTYKKLKTGKQVSHAELGLFSVAKPSNGLTDEKSSSIHENKSNSSEGFQLDHFQLSDPDIAKRIKNIKPFQNMLHLDIASSSTEIVNDLSRRKNKR